jgi:hypothetical protein
MQLSNVLFMLLGAALVAVGVLSSAIADRIRGVKITRETQPRERASRASSAPAIVVSPPVIEYAKPIPVPTSKPARALRTESKTAATDGGEDVIAALVGAGYRKPVATEATWGCTAAERATVEAWTAAALRRCARVGLS